MSYGFPDVLRYDTMPTGWKEIRWAITAPNGYVWISNRKSIFSKDYRHALLRIRPNGNELNELNKMNYDSERITREVHVLTA